MHHARSLAAGILLVAAGSALAAPMSRMERQRLVEHLEMTESWLVSEVSGLSSAQLHFRPAPGSWSILEVVEHLVVCEPIYWKNLHDALQAPPSGAGKSSSDDSVLWYGIDRTWRQKAIAGEEARGQLRDLATGMAAFHKMRGQMLEYANTTQDDLRGHVVERERSDAYQWLLLISTHSQRHVLQIREIKADSKYPKR